MGNVDDIGRAHVNLSEAMLFCGFPRDAADAVERGIVEADAIGISGSYGSVIRHNGIQVNFDLGRWETAARLAADSLSSGPVGEINPDRYRISRWVPLIVATGEFELARTQLDRLGELLDGVPVEAQFSGNFHAAAAELALWEGRPDDALDEIELGLERIGDQGWLWFNARLHRIGAWAAADVAEQARSRRDRQAVDDALRRGEALRVARHEILARMLEHEHGRQAAMTIAEGALADAEETRLRGSGSAAWAAARELGQGHAPVPRGVRGVARGGGLSGRRRPRGCRGDPSPLPTRRPPAGRGPCARRSSRWPSGPGSTSSRPRPPGRAPRRRPIRSG